MDFRGNHHQQPRHHHGGHPNCGSHVEYYRDDRFNCEEDRTTYVTTVEKKTTVSEGPRHFANKPRGYKHKEVYEEDEVLERGKLVERDGYVICESERFGCEDEVDMETEEFVSRKHNYMVKAA